MMPQTVETIADPIIRFECGLTMPLSAVLRVRRELERAEQPAVVARRRAWTLAEDEHLRAHYSRVPGRQLASQLGRTDSAVYKRARDLGLSRELHWLSDDQVVSIIRELHPLGWCDTEIAAEAARRSGVPVDRHRCSELRRSIGLAANTFSGHERQRVRKRTQQQLKVAGLSSLAELRLDRWQKWKRGLGWPESLSMRAVQSLEMFYQHGPLTRIQLCALLGVSSAKRTAPTSNRKGGTVLGELQRAGLISRIRKAVEVPFEVKTHGEPPADRKSTRKYRVKHLDLYLLNPGVMPNGRKAAERVTAG